MRVPLGDLRSAFQNPAKYARSFHPGGGGGGPSKYGMFLHAIGEFHRTGNLATAQDYLEEKLTKNFKTATDIASYAQSLEVYAREFRRQGNSLIRYRDNISIPIAPAFTNLVVSGQASRVDLAKESGYAIWMFVRGDTEWAEDPKMPLLQYAYANKLNVSLGEISVGIYDFATGVYGSRHYSQSDIKRTRLSLELVLQELDSRFNKSK